MPVLEIDGLVREIYDSVIDEDGHKEIGNHYTNNATGAIKTKATPTVSVKSRIMEAPVVQAAISDCLKCDYTVEVNYIYAVRILSSCQ